MEGLPSEFKGKCERMSPYASNEKNRTVKELREWLSQFDEEDEVWGYEGEVQGIIVRHQKDDGQYAFHNDLGSPPFFPPSALNYPQEHWPRNDEHIHSLQGSGKNE